MMMMIPDFLPRIALLADVMQGKAAGVGGR